MSSEKVVQRHLTVNGVDQDGNILPTIQLKPGDTVPPELADMVQDHWFEPLPGEQAVVTDDDSGTELRESPYINDDTSPTKRAGLEDPSDVGLKQHEQAYSSMNKDQLRALLEERQQPVSGTRQEMIERLQTSDAEVS